MPKQFIRHSRGKHESKGTRASRSRQMVNRCATPRLRQVIPYSEQLPKTMLRLGNLSGAFRVTFRYKLLSDNVDVEFLESPGIVKLEAPLPEIIIDYSWLSLGKWKAQLKSAHGEFSQLFNLKYSGPKGEWLDGTAMGSKGESEEIDFGHREGNFLTFMLRLKQPDGQRVETFLIGKMKGREIVGTFVDHAGITGQWTAVRVGNSPNPR